MEGRARFRIAFGILHRRKKDLKGEQALRIKAGIHAEDAQQAATQQTGAGEEHGRETELQNREHVARNAAARAPAFRVAFLERRVQVEFRPRESRRERSEEHTSELQSLTN